MPIDLVCQKCGKPFRVKPKDATQKYCSVGCMRGYETENGRIAARAEPVHFACKQCGGGFTMKPSYLTAYRKKWDRDPMYCSMRCMGDAKKLTDEQWQVTCIQCGNPMPIQRRTGGTVNRQKRLCSTACRSTFRRISYQETHPDTEVSRRQYRHGYYLIYIPGKNGEPPRELLEHRYVMEQSLGRELLPQETVHHRDGNRGRNVVENLELFSSRHGPGQRVIEKVAFAVEMIRLYPEFALSLGVKLIDCEPVPLEMVQEGDMPEHAPFSTPP